MTIAMTTRQVALPARPRHHLTLADHAFLRALAAASRVAGVSVRAAHSEAERADGEAVAAAVLGDREGHIPSDLAPVGARYARMATTLVAYDRGRPVGTLTLYLPTESSRTVESAALRLPHGIEPSEVVDIGRLAVLPSHRGGARLVLLGLLGAAQRISQRAGRRWWVGVTAAGLVDVFRWLNPTVRPLPLAAVDTRPPEVVRYWAAYRAHTSGRQVPFILEYAGGSPVSVLTRHCLRLLRRRR